MRYVLKYYIHHFTFVCNTYTCLTHLKKHMCSIILSMLCTAQTDTVCKTITKYYITMLMFGYYIFSITSIIAKLRTHEVFPERRMRASSVLTLTLHCTQKNWIFGSSIHPTEVKRYCIFIQRNFWLTFQDQTINVWFKNAKKLKFGIYILI